MSDPFELGKRNFDWRNSKNNTRGQNTSHGAAIGAAEGVAGGAALGGYAGARRAQRGVRELATVGAAPSRARAAHLVASHGARTAGKTAVGLGAVGALAGTYAGAVMMPARKRKAKVQKNDRHMSPAPATARLAGALPKHSAEAQAVAQAAGTRRRVPVGPAIRGTLRATTIAKGDPFQPEAVAKKKIPAVLPGEKVAPRGFKPKKLPARSVRDSSGRGAQGQRRAVRSGKV